MAVGDTKQSTNTVLIVDGAIRTGVIAPLDRRGGKEEGGKIEREEATFFLPGLVHKDTFPRLRSLWAG